MREYFIANVTHWISEYHFDGLRIDATQAFEDDSAESILVAICRAARQAALGRSLLIVGENEPQNAQLLRGDGVAGLDFDLLWNDDFHHSAMVCLTGKREAYYTDYTGSGRGAGRRGEMELSVSGAALRLAEKAARQPGFRFARRRFVNYLQNHDQLANSARGQRIHELTSPGRYRAMTALLLLAPQTPLLFQGQEFAASSPFLYFNDCSGRRGCGGRTRSSQILEPIPLAGDRLKCRPRCSIPLVPTASSGRSSISPSATRMPKSTPCIAIC